MIVRQLVPEEGTVELATVLERLAGAGHRFAPFSPEMRDFCAAFSRALFTDERCRRLPDIQALAFRMRPAEIDQLEKAFRESAPTRGLLQPRGLAFHVAPANVDTMFVYSWLFSALVGNRNILRISNSAPETSLLLCRVLRDVLAQAAESVRRSMAVVQYGHDEAITGAISAACDVRIIWGGDESVRAIRSVPLAPRATELVFADRYSFSLIHASAYLQVDAAARQKLADQFFNDTFWFDQMACSSPRLIVWLGEAEQARAAADAFLQELERAIDRKHYGTDAGTRLNRFTFACRAVLDGPVSEVDRFHGRFEAVWLSELTPFCLEHCGGGLLFQFCTDSLEPVMQFVERRIQTLTYFGFAGEQLHELAEKVSARGVDRVVPIGQGLNFDRYWDGYDLFLELTRHVDVR